MRKIMIVDDEFLVRVGIKSILNWEEHGYSVVCEAVNGADALEKMNRYHPDIVLTDLKMDKMDGFELITRCKNQYPKTRFIVLSSYNDYDNVRKAMKLGAVDYIFKLTVKPNDMLGVLDEVSKSMEETSANDAGSIVLKNISAIKNRLIKTAIQQSYFDPSELTSEFQALKLKTDFSRSYVSLYISIDNFYARQRNGTLSDIQPLKFSMENIVQEIMGKNLQVETYNYDQGDLIVLINSSAEESYDHLCAEVKKSVLKIIEYIRRYLSVEVTASLSGVSTGVGQIKRAVEQNQKALSARFLSGGGTLYVFHDAEDENSEFVLPDGLKPASMEESLWKNDFTQLQAYLNAFWTFCREEPPEHAGKIRIELLELYYCLRKHALKNQVDLDDLVDENGFTLYEAITRYDMISAIETGFGRVVDQYQNQLANHAPKKCHSEIETVKQYVRKNLSSVLSVKEAAELVNMSESYFSHLFKSETGISFINYVNKVRIEYAETLLRSTDGRISDIAMKVGIDNPNYFSILFKKITGQSPNQYRS